MNTSALAVSCDDGWKTMPSVKWRDFSGEIGGPEGPCHRVVHSGLPQNWALHRCCCGRCRCRRNDFATGMARGSRAHAGTEQRVVGSAITQGQHLPLGAEPEIAVLLARAAASSINLSSSVLQVAIRGMGLTPGDTTLSGLKPGKALTP